MSDRNRLFARLVEIVSELRGDNGCPWDKAQTHETLKTDLLEETYEVLEAIDLDVSEKLKEELGDLLMQVMLHSQIASEDGRFDVYDVIELISEKLIRRHPHVFADVTVADAKEALSNWEAIKRSEESNRDRESVLDGVPAILPGLLRARKLQDRASRVGFDWSHPEEVIPKIFEEVKELIEAARSGDRTAVEEEIGDLLFAIVNFGRLMNIEPEEAMRKANEKFSRRFRELERRIAREGKDIREMSLEEMDAIWDEIKEEWNDS